MATCWRSTASRRAATRASCSGRITPSQASRTLPAVLKTGGSGDFGSTLTVTVPPLAGGAGSLTEFQTSVKAKDYVSARCHDGDKKLNVKAKFTYDTNNPPNDGGGPDNTSAFSKCST